MFKSIIKEIFIMLLLIIAILLILGIIFYGYNPSKKKIPTPVEEYTMPQEMQEELEETLEQQETQNIVKTYRIDADDLRGYERSQDYKKGKVNPFAPETKTISTDSEESDSSGGSSGTTDSGATSDGTTNNEQTSSNDNTQNSNQGRFIKEVK